MNDEKKRIVIGSPIANFKVVTEEDLGTVKVAEQAANTEVDELPDFDPTKEILTSAPRGYLISDRLATDYTKNGVQHTMYTHASFHARKGIHNGEEFIVACPVETFAREKADDMVETAMVLASQSLQGAVSPTRIIKKLIGMKSSDTIMMRLPTGKQKILTSMSQVIGLSLALIMKKHGVINFEIASFGGTDIDNLIIEDVPYEDRPRLVKVGEEYLSIDAIKEAAVTLGITADSVGDDVQEAADKDDVFDEDQSVGAAKVKWQPSGITTGKKCPDCGTGNLVLKDGCVQCDGSEENPESCGYSKCG